MPIRGIDFVQYSAQNWEAAVAFYQEALGLNLADCFPEIEYAKFDVSGITLTIAGPKYGEIPIPDYHGGATVALAVDDIAEMISELKAKGVTIMWGLLKRRFAGLPASLILKEIDAFSISERMVR